MSNYYYYTNTGSYWGNFWSNYWLYRVLTPSHRMYVDSYGTTCYAPAYTGIRSIMSDIITLIVLVIVIIVIVKIVKNKKRRY